MPELKMRCRKIVRNIFSQYTTLTHNPLTVNDRFIIMCRLNSPMVERQLQKKSEIPASDMDFHTWSSIAQNVEDGELRARVTDWEFDSEVVTVHYRIPEIPNKDFSEELDAKIYPDRKSEFEKLLSRYEYEDYHQGVLKDEMIDLEVKRQDEELQFHLKKDDKNVNDESEETEMADFVTKDTEAKLLEPAVIAVILSLIPFVNLFLFYDIVSRDSIDELVDNQTEYAVLTMLSSAIFVAVYIVIPVLWYLIG